VGYNAVQSVENQTMFPGLLLAGFLLGLFFDPED
jgi:hypothetical protein